MGATPRGPRAWQSHNRCVVTPSPRRPSPPPVIDIEELAAWLRLLESPGSTRAGVRRLLAAFGGPHSVLRAPATARATRVDAAFADSLNTVTPEVERLIDATASWLHGASPDAPRHVVTLGDPDYPPLLLQTADPPLLLYVLGDPARCSAPSIAIVGSRSATAQGLDHARAFGRHLSERGLTVISGLAAGIDAAAHEGALKGPGGTVAVVGTGLDIVFPERHAALAARIARAGAVVSEYPLGTPPRGINFPQRNRIIAGLSFGTLVVEAALASGSLITARQALEACREVFAIPGSVHSPQSRGCHLLIQQGAKLVETGDDIIEELGFGTVRAARAATPADPSTPDPASAHRTVAVDHVLEAMGYDPIDIDELSARTGMGAAALGARLLSLELEGRVARLPGGRLQRRAAS